MKHQHKLKLQKILNCMTSSMLEMENWNSEGLRNLFKLNEYKFK